MAVYHLTALLVLLVSNLAVFHVVSEEVQPLMSGLDFLETYGYMDKPDPNAYKLITDIQLQEAIIKLQRYFRLPETGQIDQRTAELMRKPRCGLPDLTRYSSGSRNGAPWGTDRRGKRFATADGIRWDKRDLTYSFDSYTSDMSRAQTRDSIKRAMKVWSDVTPLTFRETTGNPDIHIEFARGQHASDEFAFDGRGGTLAHAFFPGEEIGGDAHFDDDEIFTYNSYAGTNLFTVAAHELGHSLGLGHSDVPGSLMAPYYQEYDPNFYLPYDDIRGIQSLYGSNPRPPPPSRPKPPPRPRPTSPPERPEPTDPTTSPTCLGKFSAMSNIRGEIFLFNDDQMWRLASDGKPLTGYPMATSRFWKSAPSSPDAVFEKLDGTIVFVKGAQYWEFDGLNLIQGFPKSLLSLTEGKTADVDAAVSLRREAKTYFFKGALCWRFDGTSNRMENGYPKFIRDEWIGGPEKVDGAFTFKGDVYLVNNNRYWRFNDGSMTTPETETTWFTVDVLGCSPDSVVTDDGNDGDKGAASRTVSGLWICVLSTLVALLSFR